MNTNNTAKTITQFVTGKIPYAGPVLSQLIGLFWPTTGPDLWAEIESQVEDLIQQDLSKYNLEKLQQTLQGLQDDTTQYSAMTSGEAKAARLQAIISACLINAPQFLAGNPAHNFSCFWGFAMLHLTMLKEQDHTLNTPDSATQLADAAMGYSKYAQVGLSRIYNRPLQLEPVISRNVPGKAGKWQVYFVIEYADTNTIAFQIDTIYDSGWPAVLDQDTQQANAALDRIYPGSEKQAKLATIAYAAVEELLGTWPFDEQTGLAKLKAIIGDDAYQEFVDQYYPTQSIYNNPVTTQPLQTTPARPAPVNLNTF